MPETCQRMELHNTDTVLVLCKQLSSYHAESSTEEMENSCIQTLHQIASKLSSHKPSNDVILAVGGRSSHLLQCLSSAAAKLRWRVVVAAVQCIQALVDHLVVDQTAKVPGSVAAQAMADIMQLLTLQLQTRYPIPNVCHSEALYGLLRVAKLILQSCLRDSILPHSFITVCRPYMFYGLPAYRSAFVDAGAHLDAMDRLQDEAELLMSSDYDPESSVKNHFTNRNRRKRLRRKKTNPGRNQPAHGPHAPLSSTSEGSCASRSRFSSFSAASRAMPVQLRPPQLAEMTAALGFRCSQASGAESTEKTVTSKSEENPREEVLLQDPEVDAREYMALDTQRNLSNGQRGDCSHDTPAEVVTGGHDAPAEVVTSSRGTPAEAVTSSRGTPVEAVTSSRGTPTEAVTSSRGTPVEVVTSGSEWEELTEDEEGVWSASHHTARVRQAALAALSSLVTMLGSDGKLRLWVPLLCQSPTLLVCLLGERQSGVRSAALSLVALLLSDARRHIANATDQIDRAAYSSLSQQLGTSVRELHRVLTQVLMSERSTDGAVRSLKTLELLVDNVTYSRLAPGLLSCVASCVKPFVTHTEAVVRANALSVMVSVLLVKPSVREVRQLLLHYAAPHGRPSHLDTEGSFVMLCDEPHQWDEETPDEETNSELDNVSKALSGSSISGRTADRGSVPHSKGNVASAGAAATARSANEVSTPTLIDAANMIKTNEMNAANEIKTATMPPQRRSLPSRRSFLYWLLDVCIGSLLPPAAARGVHVQVLLQSLRVLSALLSEHFCLVYFKLGLIQRVIADHCAFFLQTTDRAGQLNSEACHPPSETGVVLKHVFPLLSSLVALLKKECDASLRSDPLPPPAPRVPSSCTDRASGNAIVPQESAKDDRDSAIETSFSPSEWRRLALDVWLWTLQEPLQGLLQLPAVDPAASSCNPGVLRWCAALTSASDAGDMARCQLVAAAGVFTHITSEVTEHLSEPLLESVMQFVLWLIGHSHRDLSVWGVRVCGCISEHPAVQRSPLAVTLICAAVTKGTALLAAADECERLERSDDEVSAGGAVNKTRLMAMSALANLASSLKHYSPGHPEKELLPCELVEQLLEVAIAACNDKSKVRPHGVRCLGSTIGWLRDVAYQQQQGNLLSPQRATWWSVKSAVISRALTTLVDCCSRGSNMKMRWNACHALGHLLQCPLPIEHTQKWRDPIVTLLCDLIGGFHNFKVRIQACGALCSLPCRELYTSHYCLAWKSLLAAANSSQNVVDYLEILHREDLIRQVVQGMWHLSSMVALADSSWLRSALLENQESVAAVVRRANVSLPPHQWEANERAQQHVLGLMQGSDALTDEQAEMLTLLQELLLEPRLPSLSFDSSVAYASGLKSSHYNDLEQSSK